MRPFLAGLLLLLSCEAEPPLPVRPTPKMIAPPATDTALADMTVAFRANHRPLGSVPAELTAFGKPATQKYEGQTLQCIQWLQDPDKLLCADMSRRGENGLGELVYFYKGEATDYHCPGNTTYHWSGCE